MPVLFVTYYVSPERYFLLCYIFKIQFYLDNCSYSGPAMQQRPWEGRIAQHIGLGGAEGFGTGSRTIPTAGSPGALAVPHANGSVWLGTVLEAHDGRRDASPSNTSHLCKIQACFFCLFFLRQSETVKKYCPSLCFFRIAYPQDFYSLVTQELYSLFYKFLLSPVLLEFKRFSMNYSVLRKENIPSGVF